MQVSVEVTQGLERQMLVKLPTEALEVDIDKKLRQIAKTARMDGFRPGKVPLKMVRNRYYSQVFQEVFSEHIDSSFAEALHTQGLSPVGRPDVQVVESEEPGFYAYQARFEVLPEVRLQPFDGQEVERPQVELTEADLEQMVEKLRDQSADWRPVERGASAADKVQISYVGRIGGEVFEGGQAERVDFVLGGNALVADFEQGLLGMQAGEQRTLQVRFPDDYQQKTLAGQEAEFVVDLHQVSEKVLPEVDDAFVARFGVTEGGVERFRQEVRANMEREMRRQLEKRLKTQVMDLLLRLNPIELPNTLLNNEITALRQQVEGQIQGQAGQRIQMPDSLFADEARRRVSLGVLMSAWIQQEQVRVDPARVRRAVEDVAASYENPQEVIDYTYSNREQLRSMENVVMEQQLVDWVLERVQVRDVPMGFYQLTDPANASAGAESA